MGKKPSSGWNHERFAENLNVLMAENADNATTVSNRCNLAKETVERYLRGQRKPNSDSLDELAKAFKVERKLLVAGCVLSTQSGSASVPRARGTESGGGSDQGARKPQQEPQDVESPTKSNAESSLTPELAGGATRAGMSSAWERLPSERVLWHYSLTYKGKQVLWQATRLAFAEQGAGRVIARGTWIGADGREIQYDVELLAFGERTILTFTQVGAKDHIPTIEIYPKSPEPFGIQLAGIAIDRTWDRRDVLAATVVADAPLHNGGGDRALLDLEPADAAIVTTRWRELFQHEFLTSHMKD